MLAAEIPEDLREFTVHDVTHLDALWELADLVVGPEIHLTPAEGFVLGGAFMMHDLGMALAAWPGGLGELESDPHWDDALAAAELRLANSSQGFITPEQLHEAAVGHAKATLLRERHAEHGTDLGVVSWRSKASDQEYWLIEDQELRSAFGPLIGEIASSHGWDVEKTTSHFGDLVIGAPVDCPDEWTVEPLKLAFILRTADAAHLDRRRAPGFLRALRKPEGYSDLHWAFQGYLQRAQRSDDRLVFTSARPFPAADANAWWLCYETLQMVNDELERVDAVLANRHRQRFAARSVKGVHSPTQLAESIRTQGWQPVDASIRVSNVPELVRKLGGESLYGDRPRIALRELIQNARDASRALESIVGQAAAPILVSLEEDGDGAHWLTVTDHGIGMSREAMVDALLDFGSSYWGSDLMRRESVGLAASDFAPVGRFGIGFFSVFMLGDEVKVISRRFDAAAKDTGVLEFPGGTASRPLLRSAGAGEIMHSGGTTVRVRLRQPPHEPRGLLWNDSRETPRLAAVCGLLAPALDVELHSMQDGESEVVVRADDWISMDGDALLRRLSGQRIRAGLPALFDLDTVASRLRTISDGEQVLARATLVPGMPAAADGAGFLHLGSMITVGGLNAETSLGEIVGVVAGSPTTADRLSATSSITWDQWRAWGDEQVALWASDANILTSGEGSGNSGSFVALACHLDFVTGELFIARDRDHPMTKEGLLEWFAARSEVVITDDFSLDFRAVGNGSYRVWEQWSHEEIRLDENVVAVFHEGGRYGNWSHLGEIPLIPVPGVDIESVDHFELGNPRDAYYHEQRSVVGLTIRTLAEAWGLTLDQILDRAEMPVSGRAKVGVSVEDGARAVSASVAFVFSRDA